MKYFGNSICIIGQVGAALSAKLVNTEHSL